jgi:hypothetical protein
LNSILILVFVGEQLGIGADLVFSSKNVSPPSEYQSSEAPVKVKHPHVRILALSNAEGKGILGFTI